MSKIIYQLQGGLRSSLGYIGAKNLSQIIRIDKWAKKITFSKIENIYV